MQDSLLGLASGLTWSRVERARHRTDYELLKELGSGGFGRVYLVKHKLDAQLYAMKVVRTKNSDTEKILREVQVLSSIHSDHVVRYYSAWVEKGEFEDTQQEETGRSSAWESTQTEDTIPKDQVCNLCQSTYKDWEVSLEHWGLIDAVLQPLDLCVDCYQKNMPDDVDISNISIRESKNLPDCLYIVMEYCESTLLEAVKSCDHDDSTIWAYFCQTVRGLAHLHSNGVIHRDVKPNNVFVHQGVVKIGDLGLATQAEGHTKAPSDNNNNNNNEAAGASVNKSSEVGTYLYQAPEVMTGKYDEKCDVYSLGILLVEIFHHFSTGMERAKVLGNLRGGHFPDDWPTTTHPSSVQANKFTKQMLSADPKDRPSCTQILEELRHLGLCQEETSANHLVTDLNSQMRRLREEVQRKDDEIARLRTLLDANQIPYNST
jgi:translation initiation factor 2-alpha kinase 4